MKEATPEDEHAMILLTGTRGHQRRGTGSEVMMHKELVCNGHTASVLQDGKCHGKGLWWLYNVINALLSSMLERG